MSFPDHSLEPPAVKKPGRPRKTLAAINLLDAAANPSPITLREQDILSLLTHGLSDQDIAYNLQVEHSTIRSHIQQLCRKLRAINRVQLAVLATKAGLG